MRIGDAAAAAGTTPRALRFYEERGVLPPPPRTAAGQREYGPDDVARVRVVRELLALGLTVEDLHGVADRIDVLVRNPQRRCGPPDSGVPGSRVADRRLAALDAEIDRLTRLRDRLAQHVEDRPSSSPSSPEAAIPTEAQ
ncbi:MerR family copper efflux transcriptional regulator [Streptomyces phaeochromogenes]|jgi:DNA-binding transcriptional MerR regulator|uniref:MerR family transcriptional regulator n=1 Tax=Streptomyces TaxID=1883 RepID=UPI00117EC4CE|nr:MULTISPECIES: MerR family transcriptional regulator [Streptomyces]MDQ0955364.1 MerR family copper efflux transcriptional regulator [Streptomyces phaeochromogenes]TRO58247.1 MerR family transcriptional regulator [Streptomyces sp. IB201691-2A2]